MSFSRRPKAKKIILPSVQDEDDDIQSPESTHETSASAAPSPTPSPAPTPVPAFKPKKRTNLRLSFGPGTPESGGDAASGEAEEEEVFIKKPLRRKPQTQDGLRRKVLLDSTPADITLGGEGDSPSPSPSVDGGSESDTSRPGVRIRTPSRTPVIPEREGPTGYFEQRASYSKEDLAALKANTPTALKEVFDGEDGERLGDQLDEMEVDSTGSNTRGAGRMEIPNEAMVRRIKERRKQAQNGGESGDGDGFISLAGDGSDNDEDNDEYEYRTQKKKKDSRLARPEYLDDDDEELMSYVDDPRLALGPSSRRAEAQRRKADIAAAIDEAEESKFYAAQESSQESSGEEGWEREQVRKATGRETDVGGSRVFEDVADRLRYKPVNIRPLPSLSQAVAALKEKLEAVRDEGKRTGALLERCKKEEGEILRREEEVQRKLKEAGEEYARMERELRERGVGMEKVMAGGRMGAEKTMVGRGLESLGGTPVR